MSTTDPNSQHFLRLEKKTAANRQNHDKWSSFLNKADRSRYFIKNGTSRKKRNRKKKKIARP